MLTPVVHETHRLSPYAFAYETNDITEGLTLTEWRGARACKAPKWWRRIFIGRRWSA